MLWASQSAGMINYGNWQSLEKFAYSLCRTSANTIMLYGCDWSQTPPEAIKCFTLMLERADMQCKIPPEGDHLFVYRHSKHPTITQETNISVLREKRCGGHDELLCTITTYSLHTPFCPVLEHDQREEDESTVLMRIKNNK